MMLWSRDCIDIRERVLSVVDIRPLLMSREEQSGLGEYQHWHSQSRSALNADYITIITVIVVIIYKCKKTYQFKTHCKDDAMISLH